MQNYEPLGAEGIQAIINKVAEGMTYERCLELAVKAPELNPMPDIEDGNRLDRILWLVRIVYLTGYQTALEVLDQAMTEGDTA